MTTPIKIKRSGTASSTPSSLDHGELAINYADATLFWKDSSNVIQSFVFQAYASATHKSQHATGGSDALTPADIGAAPAASPAITGNATFSASSGVPVTITNTGTGNSFVVNDAAGDATPFVVDAAGIVGIQNSNPQSVTFQGLLLGAGTGNIGLTLLCSTSATGTIAFGDGTTGNESYRGYVQYLHANDAMQFGTSAATRLFISSSGNVGIGTTTPASRLDVNGVITVSATSGSAGSYLPSVCISGDSNTGFGQVSGQSDTASVFTAGHERVRVDSSGRVGIGRTPAISGTSLEVAGDIFVAPNKYISFYHTNGTAGIGTPSALGFQFWTQHADYFRFQARNADGTFAATDTLRVVVRNDGTGTVGIRTNSATAALDINADTIRLRTAKTPASASDTGNAGDICWDASYLYICTATNTWRRIAHSTW